WMLNLFICVGTLIIYFFYLLLFLRILFNLLSFAFCLLKTNCFIDVLMSYIIFIFYNLIPFVFILFF
ncbi:MAG TPA: hypothetical protein PLC92_08605, partial [Chitinophagales bacterium]|nr:hypothetical protein [Chitinophagales bacterium]